MKPKSASERNSGILLAICLLAAILGFLFWRSFLPRYVHFSNDGPLGQQMPAYLQIPDAITGAWNDLNYIGWNGGSLWPGISTLLRFLLFGPVGFSKFFAPLSLFVLGLGAWTFFTQLKLAKPAALIGAVIVALNSMYFSTACWGVASQQIAAGFNFMALALMVSLTPSMPLPIRVARTILAGFCVGMNIMEAADIGALYSMLVAAFVFYHSWVATEGSVGTRISRGVGRVILVAVCAAFIAALAITNLVGTQIKGVAGTQQDEQSKLAHWDFATQWSLPKRETLALVIPGLYGFRMDTEGGGNYWGVMGRDANWWRFFEDKLQPGEDVSVNFQNVPEPVTVKILPDGSITLPGIGLMKAAGLTRFELQKQISEAHPATVEGGQGFIRQAGGGCYMGVTAVLLALWAAFQSFRKKSVFTQVEQRLVWFLCAVIFVTLLLAYGRYAPFFQFVYALPYASTVRNPGKFLIIFTFCLTILATYGLQGLYRSYLEIPFTGPSNWSTRVKNWWAKASVFDRRWTIGCLVTIALGLIGWVAYWRSEASLIQYLQTVQFDETIAPQIASFSIRQIGWFILFLSLGTGLITLIVSGAFAGRHARTGAILLGLLIFADLGRANLPWVKHINYVEKYADNPVLEKLRDRPYEHRVAILPFRAPPEYATFDAIYRIEWAQHHFPYFNIQSLDIIQMPRTPEDLAAFESALAGGGGSPAFYYRRRWELTNTRYVLGAAGFLDVLNQQLDPDKKRFRIAMSFDIVPKPGITYPRRYEEMTAVVNPGGAGRYALFEFAGALPRVKLYSNWQVNTNDAAALKTMASPAFDPAEIVLVAGGVPPSSTGTNQNIGSVIFESYAPKDIRLKAQADGPSVLLLNDKFDPAWQVWVDGKPAEMLRCNFLMRGVYLPTKGEHTVEFVFKPDVRTLYISLAAIVLGIGLLGVVALQAKSQRHGE